MFYIVEASHNGTVFATRRVYSLDKAVRVSRYISGRVSLELGFKQAMKRLGFVVRIREA